MCEPDEHGNCAELWLKSSRRYREPHIEFDQDLSDEERVLCWNVYPGFADKEHYNLTALFYSFLIFLPITELIILVVSTARKPMPEADQWPMSACLARVQAVCAAAVGMWGGGISGAFGELVGRTRAQGWCGESAGFYIGPRGEERVQSAAFSGMARIYEGT